MSNNKSLTTVLPPAYVKDGCIPNAVPGVRYPAQAEQCIQNEAPRTPCPVFDTVEKIVDSLQPLSAGTRERILRTVCAFYGLPIPM